MPITPEQAREALDNLGYYARTLGAGATRQYNVVREYIDQQAQPAPAAPLPVVVGDSTAPVGAVTEGWKLVPVKPTMEMLFVGDAVWTDCAKVLDCTGTASLYRAMLAASPTPAAIGETKDTLVDPASSLRLGSYGGGE